MNREPLVSICLCTYNGEKFLAEQMRSILQQEYSNFELIIVDDCSTDSTFKLLSAYSDSRIKLYRNEKNIGYAGNFGRALSLSTGELIALADQDDVWAASKIRFMAEKIDQYSGIYHNSAYMTAAGELTGKSFRDRVTFIEGKEPKSLLLKNYISGHALMIKREVLDLALPIPGGIYHDWWLSFVCMNLNGMTYIDKALVNYRIHDTNQTVLARLSSKVSSCDATTLKRYKKIRKVAETVFTLKIFKQGEFIDTGLRSLLEEFIHLEKGRLKTCFSFKLFLFLLKNKSIYKSERKGFWGKFNKMRKDSRGINVY